ncbi:MAG: hypothetical protein JWQ89_3293 [Devosia sp.]|uniref:hypothetical protein n=1 Tax=Devosia sp. TaxID=1871048 RepID=UPI002623FC79|nr:hypothetical protein [Devosia sp.]MDB5541566.1 hypothetical protein [Devosia sp.]
MPATASELLEQLRSAQTASSARHALKALEDDLTPGELAALLTEFDQLSGLAKLACEASIVLPELRRVPAQPFRRRDVASDVAFFSDGLAPAAEKSLIVALCGRSDRLMLPWSLFLQFIPAAMFDVVILADRNRDDYVAGVEGYAPDLWSLVQRVLSDAGASRYQRLYCYGTSAGGLPALRFGLLAGAYRSISLGGVYSWDIHRLQSGKALPAFDPLCSCNARAEGHFVCVHASGARHDNMAAARLQRIMQMSRIPIDSLDQHNVVYPIYKAGGLPNFNAQLFDFDPLLLPLTGQYSAGSEGSQAPAAAGARS